MHVEGLALDFAQALMELTASLTEQQTVALCNILWCLWKTSNKAYFFAKKTTPAAIIAHAKQMEVPPRAQEERREVRNQVLIHISPDKDVILVDASWDVSNITRIGMLHYEFMIDMGTWWKRSVT